MAITINGDGLIDIGGTTSTQGRVRLAEDADNGTNYVELTAPASVASNRVITFPDATTEVVGTDTTQTLTNKTLTSPTITGTIAGTPTLTSPTLTSPTIGGTPVVNGSLVVSGVSQTAPFSINTRADFTSIPSWAKRITVVFSGVSTSGTSVFLVRIGSGSIDATGYTGSAFQFADATAVSGVNETTGFQIRTGQAAATISGALYLTLITGNTWVANGSFSDAASARSYLTNGTKALSGALDQIRITTANGADTFDTGSIINILYE